MRISRGVSIDPAPPATVEKQVNKGVCSPYFSKHLHWYIALMTQLTRNNHAPHYLPRMHNTFLEYVHGQNG